MGKRQVVLYGNDEDVKEAKARGLNISQLFRIFLKNQLEYETNKEIETKTQEQQIIELETKNTRLIGEIENLGEQIKKLKRQNEELEIKARSKVRLRPDLIE
jgi:hypothetical protein